MLMHRICHCHCPSALLMVIATLVMVMVSQLSISGLCLADRPEEKQVCWSEGREREPLSLLGIDTTTIRVD